MNANTNNDIDIALAFNKVLARKKTIFAIGLLFSLITGLVVFSLPDVYTSKSVLAPSQNQTSGNLPGNMQSLGGLASLAGIDVKGSSDDSAIALEIMKSWAFIENFIEKNNIQVDLIASEDWDDETGQLIYDEDRFDVTSGEWVLNEDHPKPPTSWQLFNAFKKILTIEKSKENGFINIEVDQFSPSVAKQWLEAYVKDINSFMQTRRLTQIELNIQYLNDEISKTNIAEMKTVFYGLIEDQVQAKMLTQANPEYVFTTISPAMLEESPSGPKRKLFILVAFFWGLLGSALWFLFAKEK